MTSLLNNGNDSSEGPTQSTSNSSQTKLILESNNSPSVVDQSNLSPCNDTTDLLKKRSDPIEHQDELVKKLKTHSSFITDDNSNQISTTPKKERSIMNSDSLNTSKGSLASGLGSLAEGSPSSEGLENTNDSWKTSLRIPAFNAEKANTILSGSLSDDSTKNASLDSKSDSFKSKPFLPSSGSVFSSLSLKPAAPSDNSTHSQLMRAIEKLGQKLLFLQDLPPSRETNSDTYLNQETYEIPPFIEIKNEVSQPATGKTDKKIAKKNSGDEIEEELEVYYGSIEFPFLSLSAPIQESKNKLNKEASKIEGKIGQEPKKISSKSSKHLPITSAKLSKSLLKPFKIDRRIPRKEKDIPTFDDSLTATRDETQRTEHETAAPKKILPNKKKNSKIVQIKTNNKRKGSFSAVRPTRKDSIIIQPTKKIDKEKARESEKINNKKIKENKDVKLKEIKKEQEREKAREKEKEKKNEKEKEKEKEKDKEKDNPKAKIKNAVKEEPEYYAPRVYSTGRAEREKRKNRWQMVQDGKTSPVRETVEVPVTEYMHDRDKKKSTVTSIGKEYQAEIPLLEKTKKAGKRSIKLKWSPEVCNTEEIDDFSKTVKSILRRNILQEKELSFITLNNNDINEAAKYIKANKIQIIKDLNTEASGKTS